MEINSYTAEEISRMDNVTRQTVYRNKKYIRIRFVNYRSKQNKKWYSIRYIKKSDIL